MDRIASEPDMVLTFAALSLVLTDGNGQLMPAKRPILIVGLVGTTAAAVWLWRSTSKADSSPQNQISDRSTNQAGHRPSVAPRSPSSHEGDLVESAAPSAPVDPRIAFGESLRRVEEQNGGRQLSAAETRKEIDAALRATGPSHEPWTLQAATTLSKLSTEIETLSGGAGAQISTPTCYAAGCIATISYPPSTDASQMIHTILVSKAINGWPGSKIASAAEITSSGRQDSSWILFRPDSEGSTQ
ncbi:MAG: hypothetical protein ACTHU0_34605 [Kofleriaceae bacterium]